MSESRVCDSMFAYKAVWVLWSVAATCALPMTAVADVGAEAPAVALFSTHRLCHCQETDAGRRQRTRGIHLRSVQRALRVHLRLSGHEQRQDSDVSLKSPPLTTIHVLPELVHVWGEWAGLMLKHLCQPAAIISHGSKASPDRDMATAVPLRLAPPPRRASIRSVTQVCHMPARRASWQMSHLACKRVHSPQHTARGWGQSLIQWHKWAETAVAGDTYGNANVENTRKVWMKLWGCGKNKEYIL